MPFTQVPAPGAWTCPRTRSSTGATGWPRPARRTPTGPEPPRRTTRSGPPSRARIWRPSHGHSRSTPSSRSQRHCPHCPRGADSAPLCRPSIPGATACCGSASQKRPPHLSRRARIWWRCPRRPQPIRTSTRASTHSRPSTPSSSVWLRAAIATRWPPSYAPRWATHPTQPWPGCCRCLLWTYAPTPGRTPFRPGSRTQLLSSRPSRTPRCKLRCGSPPVAPSRWAARIT